jgi:hypothetical protein
MQWRGVGVNDDRHLDISSDSILQAQDWRRLSQRYPSEQIRLGVQVIP